MSPKIQAKELVEKFDKAVNTHTNRPLKKCALIAIDLAIEVETNIFKGKVHKSYWQEVKKEIEKL